MQQQIKLHHQPCQGKEAASTMQQSAPSGYIYADEENCHNHSRPSYQQNPLSKLLEQKQRRRTLQQAKATSSLPSTTTSSEPSTTTTNTSKLLQHQFVTQTSHFTYKELGRLYQHCASTNNKNTSTGARKTKMLAEITRLKAPASTTLQKAFPIEIKKPQEKKTTF